MSSSRSVAAARARRATGNNSSTPLRAGQMQQSQPMPQQQQHPRPQQQPRPQYTRQSSVQPPVAEDPRKRPYDAKLSVSDAFALVTLRLGRVETILQKMDVSSIINKMEAGETTSEEAGTNVILKSLLSRLEDVENMAENSGGGGMTDDDMKVINDLSARLDSAKSEINDLKSTIFKMQTLIIDINQQMLPSLVNSSPRKVPVARKKVANVSVKLEENVIEEKVSQVSEEEASDEENVDSPEEDATESVDVDDEANANEDEEVAVAE